MLSIDLNSFYIGKSIILKDILFNLRNSENLIIMGSNGVGKSTLAKIICFLYKTKKSVKIDGCYIENLSAKKRSLILNYIPAKLEIYDSYIRVKEYLEQSMLKGDINLALQITGLKNKADRYCKDLSSGEAQLLLIASAFCHKAKITIFDEPIANLDPKQVKKVYELLKSDLLSQKIIITHDLNFAYRLSYPVLYMTKTKVEFFKLSTDFFENENLLRLFGESVLKKDDYVAVKL